jgi:hypothetical protein
MRPPLCTLTAASAILAVSASGAFAADRAVPKIAFSGSYSFAFKITNVKNVKPTRWTYSVIKPCTSPCRAVAFHLRLQTETTWRRTVQVYTWNGSDYAVAPRVQRGLAGCAGRGGTSVSKGYDVTSTISFHVTATAKGRVLRVAGTGTDSYVPNAAGKKAGCKPGSYVFAVNASAQ